MHLVVNQHGHQRLMIYGKIGLRKNYSLSLYTFSCLEADFIDINEYVHIPNMIIDIHYVGLFSSIRLSLHLNH